MVAIGVGATTVVVAIAAVMGDASPGDAILGTSIAALIAIAGGAWVIWLDHKLHPRRLRFIRRLLRSDDQ
jgi:hypothetical protein